MRPSFGLKKAKKGVFSPFWEFRGLVGKLGVFGGSGRGPGEGSGRGQKRPKKAKNGVFDKKKVNSCGL